jgi:ABC-type Fe3+ transport system permease subunit
MKITAKLVVFSIISIVIIGLLILTIFTSKQTAQENNYKSLDRMIKIKRSLIAAFGQYWVVNIIMYVVLVAVILGLLFFYTTSDKYNITISDHNGRMIYWTGITMCVMFGIIMISLTVSSYINGQDSGYVKNSVPSYQEEEKKQTRVMIVKIVAVALLIITIILSIFLYRRIHKQKLDGNPHITSGVASGVASV